MKVTWDNSKNLVWTERDEDVVRIISARWATTREQTLYRDHFGGRDG